LPNKTTKNDAKAAGKPTYSN